MSTDKKPLLSLCIPTYNRATFLDETLRSIEKNISDNTNEIEIVISHNPSDDNTVDIIERYRKSYPLQYIRNEINIGPERNLCRVIAAASGKYVWLLGDDIFWGVLFAINGYVF